MRTVRTTGSARRKRRIPGLRRSRPGGFRGRCTPLPHTRRERNREGLVVTAADADPLRVTLQIRERLAGERAVIGLAARPALDQLVLERDCTRLLERHGIHDADPERA